LFKTTPLSWSEWSHAILVGATVLPVISLEKWLRTRQSHTPFAIEESTPTLRRTP
jgi:hypothetical protein